MRYRGDTYAMNWSQAAVTRGGGYALVKFEYEYDFTTATSPRPPRSGRTTRSSTSCRSPPPRALAGQILPVHGTWTRRSSRARPGPTTPASAACASRRTSPTTSRAKAADGLRTNDDFGKYNGATDRYSWKLVGKKADAMLYNSYKMSDPSLKYWIMIVSSRSSGMPSAAITSAMQSLVSSRPSVSPY